ncbi:MAG: helix-turn-helix domain-containing protein [Pseudomonadota bacterium]
MTLAAFASLRRRRALALALAAPGLAASVAHAQVPDPCVSALAAFGPDDVLTLEEAAEFVSVDPEKLRYATETGAIEMPARKILGEWRFSKSALLAWFAGADFPAECLAAAQAKRSERRRAARLAEAAPERVAPTPQPTPQPAPPAREAAAPAETPTEDRGPDAYGEDPDLLTADQIALRADQVVLRKGELTLEANLSYARGGRGAPVVTPFLVDFVETTQEVYSANVVARFGLLNNLQASLTAPFSLVETSGGEAVGIPNEVDRSSDNVSVNFNYALAAEGVYRPNIIVTAGASIPVESGSFGASAGISLLKRFDPAVLLGSVTYNRQFIGDDSPLEELAPRDSITATLGLTLALNDRLSTSGTVIGSFALGSDFDVALPGALDPVTAIRIPGDRRYALRWALTALVTENLYIEPSVTFDIGGLNDDVTFAISLPYTF